MALKKLRKKHIKRWLRREVFGRPIFQPFFSWLQRFAIAGMNYGNGSKITTSGELPLLRHLATFAIHHGVAHPVIFDVGACNGEYALAAKEVFGAANIYTFEPSATAYQDMLPRLKGHPTIHAFNIGFSNRSGEAILYGPGIGTSQNSLFKRDVQDHTLQKPYNTQEPVLLTTVHQFCEEQHIQHIFLMKIDVEGGELLILEGAKEMLGSGKISFIQFEFGAPNIDSRTYFRDFFHLLNEHYHLYRVLAHGLAPIEHYHEYQEVFTVTNFLATHRSLDFNPRYSAR